MLLLLTLPRFVLNGEDLLISVYTEELQFIICLIV